MNVLIICGSPRKGNSETIVNKFKMFFDNLNAESEIILLREKNINRCNGCMEYCNKNLKCHIKDDMSEILDKMRRADNYVFVLPNYFSMPPGIFKDFIDRCSIFYTAQEDLSKKKAIVVCVGADVPEETDKCLHNVTDNFCEVLGMNVLGAESFQSRSELNGNYNDIFENKLDNNIEKKLLELAKKLV